MGKLNNSTEEIQNILNSSSATTENTIAINNEIIVRVSGDTINAEAIIDESEYRIETDIILNNAITGETESREIADIILNNAITGETLSRIEDDNILSERIDLCLTGETQGLQSVLSNGSSYVGSNTININTSGQFNLTGGTSGVNITATQMGSGIVIDANSMTAGLILKCGANSGGVAIQADGVGIQVLNNGGISKTAIVSSKILLPNINVAPESSTATGDAGEIRWTSSYLYICVATNSWKRISLASF